MARKKATLTKEERITQEMRKLRKLFHDLPENKLKLCEKMIENAAFMAATLEELQETVNREGAVIVGTNGNGFEVRSEHPAQKSYNVMISRYTVLISKLAEMLPDEAIGDKLEDFLNGI